MPPDTKSRIASARLDLGAAVVRTLIPRKSDSVAFALGDGRVVWRRLAEPETQRWTASAHDGGLLCADVAADGPGIVTGGDDKRLVLSRPGESEQTLWTAERGWVETVLSHPESRQIVVSGGKLVTVLSADGSFVSRFDQHPSAVTATALDTKGKRLAVAHYGGVSLWWVRLPDQPVKKLQWKGSHVALTYAPDGRFVVTGTQENELHGWRLGDFQDMRMSGYSAKVRSMSWSKDGKWLATAGSEAVILWGFAGKGPMGTSPMQLGGETLRLQTAVACHPRDMLVASGDDEGRVQIHRIGDKATLDLGLAGGARVTSLAWSGDGGFLVAGCEDGGAAVFGLGR